MISEPIAVTLFDTMFKVDIFIRKMRAFDQSQLLRRVRTVVATEPEQTMYIASAEDTILAKLEWYLIGGQMSDRQWRDILGVLKAQGQRLDLRYMQEWAQKLNLSTLLDRALGDAGIPQDSSLSHGGIP